VLPEKNITNVPGLKIIVVSEPKAMKKQREAHKNKTKQTVMFLWSGRSLETRL